MGRLAPVRHRMKRRSLVSSKPDSENAQAVFELAELARKGERRGHLELAELTGQFLDFAGVSISFGARIASTRFDDMKKTVAA